MLTGLAYLAAILVHPVIHGLAKPLGLRQQVVATAIVYFRRFYVRNSFRQCDPLLLGPTCVYLACKIEEFPPIPAATLVEKLRTHGTPAVAPAATAPPARTADEYIASIGYRACAVPRGPHSPVNEIPLLRPYPFVADDILECEYYIIEELDGCVAVFHPYRPLTQCVTRHRRCVLLLNAAFAAAARGYSLTFPHPASNLLLSITSPDSSRAPAAARGTRSGTAKTST